MNNIRKLLIVALTGFALSACAQQMGSPQPSMSTLDAVRSSDIPAMRVGTFAPAPTLPASKDKSIGSRAVTLEPPGGSLAKYLGNALENDLRMGGKLDPKADLVLEGLLTASDLDTGMDTGKGNLGAKFSLKRDGKSIFEKDLSVQAQWDSSFVGAVAIPEAINQYTALYDKLATALFTDSDFKAAVKVAPK